jgi:hypothetical protein
VVSVNENVVPVPRVLVALIVPPCASMMHLEM